MPCFSTFLIEQYVPQVRLSQLIPLRSVAVIAIQPSHIEGVVGYVRFNV